MKKLIKIILFAFVLSIVLTACSNKCADQKIVEISGVGTLKVPNDWIVTHKENILYITDQPINEEGYRIYLLGDEGDNGKNISPYELFEGVEYVGNVKGVNYSNSAAYFLQEYNISGNISRKYIIHLYSSKKTVNLIAWDDLIDETTIIKIAQSYESYT